MNLHKLKICLYSTIIIMFLIAGIYINFQLDKDFLTSFGFNGFFVLVSIFFFIGMKILAELLFFRLNGLAKYFVGAFALFVVIGSILSVFFVRIHKSESMFSQKENVNLQITKQNSEIEQDRQLLLSQIKSIESQIKSKQDMIKEASGDENKWLRHKYNKDINTLNDEKLKLVTEVRNIKTKEISITRKETSLHDALNKIFGVQTDTLTIVVNLIFTIFVDGSLILLCFGLSYVIGLKEVEKVKEFIAVREERPKYTVGKPFKPEPIIEQKEVNYDDLIKKLKSTVNNSSLNQESFAKEKLGISKVALWKITSGKTKNISPNVLEKIKQSVM